MGSLVSRVPRCLNDGQELEYMKRKDNTFLYDSADDCCEVHYVWAKQECRANSLGAFKWYPAFNFREGGCRNDGLAPRYMNDEYMSDTLEECCSQYYPMNVRGCIDPILLEDPCRGFEEKYLEMYNEDYLKESELGFYPDFDSGD